VWDMRAARPDAPMCAFTDAGCVRACAMCVSDDDTFVAVGANTGIVNVYDGATVMTRAGASSDNDAELTVCVRCVHTHRLDYSLHGQ
jgi:hypothetical protein